MDVSSTQVTQSVDHLGDVRWLVEEEEEAALGDDMSPGRKGAVKKSTC